MNFYVPLMKKHFSVIVDELVIVDLKDNFLSMHEDPI